MSSVYPKEKATLLECRETDNLLYGKNIVNEAQNAHSLKRFSEARINFFNIPEAHKCLPIVSYLGKEIPTKFQQHRPDRKEKTASLRLVNTYNDNFLSQKSPATFILASY